MSSQQKLELILRKIHELAAEAQALSMALPQRRSAPGSNKQTESMLKDFYDFNSSSIQGSWKTCSTVCCELGIEKTRANCSMVGRCLSSIGVASKRSNGKSLVFMPPQLEKF